MEAGMLEWVAMVFSWLSAGIGLPTQIYKNWQRRSCEGFALPGPLFGFFSCCFWLAVGICKNHTAFCLAQIPGLVFLVVILAQFICYRDKKPEVVEESLEPIPENASA